MANMYRVSNLGSVRDCREFYRTHPEKEIVFDINKIKLVTIDIEVKSEKGFPTVQACDEEMLCITLQDYATKRILTFGVGATITMTRWSSMYSVMMSMICSSTL